MLMFKVFGTPTEQTWPGVTSLPYYRKDFPMLRGPNWKEAGLDGDLPMLQWVAGGKGARFELLVHHTDDLREWAYDRQSSVGHLDKALDEAAARGWTVVDMKADWKVVYPAQASGQSAGVQAH